jgi:LPXTG-motif cell wall-anchored protein
MLHANMSNVRIARRTTTTLLPPSATRRSSLSPLAIRTPRPTSFAEILQSTGVTTVKSLPRRQRLAQNFVRYALYVFFSQPLTISLANTIPSPGGVVTSTPAPSSTSQSKKKSKSKAWIAGAVVGPILGIALIAGLIFFFMRRKKNKNNALPQSGTAVMGPPPGVTDAKPQMATNTGFAQQPSPGFNPHESYNQQGYVPTSPAPQYSQPFPPPAQDPSQAGYAGAYTPDNKQAYNAGAAPSQPLAAELGGASTSGPAAGQSYTAELSGDGTRPQR